MVAGIRAKVVPDLLTPISQERTLPCSYTTLLYTSPGAEHLLPFTPDAPIHLTWDESTYTKTLRGIPPVDLSALLSRDEASLRTGPLRAGGPGAMWASAVL